MSRKPTYQAAQTVAAAVEAHFRGHLADARLRGELELAPEPNAGAIEAIIDATFWASLRPEEGRFPRISLALLPPDQAGQPLIFEQRLPLTPSILTKLAPSVERPGIHLGVWGDDDELHIWGTTRVIPSFCFVLEDIEPGLLVVKHRRADRFGKYANVAVLKGGHVKLVDERGTSLPDCPALLKALLAFTASDSRADSVNVLVQLAASMRSHGHGGTLLVVPVAAQNWRQSIVQPVIYSIAPPFSALADLVRLDLAERKENLWEGAVRSAVDHVAGLTAVDGATIISEDYEVLAFGAKIARPPGSAPVEKMVVTEPILGDEPRVVHPVQHGGTRHLSAAQFVHDQRETIALVASQDGRFTIFAWSPCEKMVHAHRVDALLL
ncbi:MAG TPA: hypothetical protein VJ124_06665 [Pyrinomonadaceae bacterium]|nr:hypothetical protein [Pyrinomonadaceae bacterium]